MKHENRGKGLTIENNPRPRCSPWSAYYMPGAILFFKIVELDTFYSLNAVLPHLAKVCFMLVYYVGIILVNRSYTV